MADLKTTDNMTAFPASVYHRWDVSIQGDEPAVFRLADTESAEHYGVTEVNWEYPKQPLTLVIETPYSKKADDFNVAFLDRCLSGLSVHRIVDGEEIVVDTTEEKVLVPADSNRQVVIKLVPRAKTYHRSVKYIPELFFVPFGSF